jgi:hypothetical protein
VGAGKSRAQQKTTVLTQQKLTPLPCVQWITIRFAVATTKHTAMLAEQQTMGFPDGLRESVRNNKVF